jgi:ferredoxin-like protein FixX
MLSHPSDQYFTIDLDDTEGTSSFYIESDIRYVTMNCFINKNVIMIPVSNCITCGTGSYYDPSRSKWSYPSSTNLPGISYQTFSKYELEVYGYLVQDYLCSWDAYRNY